MPNPDTSTAIPGRTGPPWAADGTVYFHRGWLSNFAPTPGLRLPFGYQSHHENDRVPVFQHGVRRFPFPGSVVWTVHRRTVQLDPGSPHAVAMYDGNDETSRVSGSGCYRLGLELSSLDIVRPDREIGARVAFTIEHGAELV
jgi:hypothetical protein